MAVSGCMVTLLGAGAGARVAGTTYGKDKLEDEVHASVPKVQEATVDALKVWTFPGIRNKAINWEPYWNQKRAITQR